MKKTFTEEIRDGMIQSSKPEFIETAKKFMEDNGFKLNSQGKLVACSEVEQWAERTNAPTELSMAIQTAIISL